MLAYDSLLRPISWHKTNICYSKSLAETIHNRFVHDFIAYNVTDNTPLSYRLAATFHA